MKFLLQVTLYICSLLFVGGLTDTSSSLCDDFCDCSSPNISCSGVNFREALNHTIPSDVANSTTSLEILIFSETLIIGNEMFQNFNSLQRLTIATYPIAFIDEFVFKGLSDLSYIYLELNSLAHLPNAVFSHANTSLQELHLIHQEMTNIPANSFVHLANLRKLTISRNFQYLNISAGAFAGLTNLTHLDLSASNISTLQDRTFRSLQNLQELDLSYNLLVAVPTAVHFLKSLTKLDLSHNVLLDNPRHLMFLEGMPKLQVLQMGFCAISGISSDAVQNLNVSNELIVANFDGNPFNCTKYLCSFASWYVSLPESSTTTRSPTGKGPYQCEGSGQSLQDFYHESCLPAPDPTARIVSDDSTNLHLIIIAVSVILAVFVVVIVSFIVWKFRLINHYHDRFGIHFHRRVNYGVMRDDIEYIFDAYISHHEDDKPFVEDQMLRRLEDENGFDLCVSFRNFRLGSDLLENVSSAQDVSRAMIFIINERFMQNGQCKLELEMASTRMLEDEMDHGGQRLILILMEVLPPELVNNTLRMLLNQVAYLEWDPTAEDRCWGQLISTLRTMVPERNDDNEQVVDEERNANDEPAGNEHIHEQHI